MKEATGELNATVVVVVLVAGLSLFFFSYLWPSLSNGLDNRTSCDEAICECNDINWKGGKCVSYKCYVKGSNKTKEIKCAWKG